MGYVENNAGPGDIIVVAPNYESVTAEYYHERKDLKIIPLVKKFPAFENLGRRNIWFIFHADAQNQATAKSGLSWKYDIKEFRFYRLDLFLLREKQIN